MKTCNSFLFLLFLSLVAVSQPVNNPTGALSGNWVRLTSSGPVGLSFEPDDIVKVDFGNDGSADVFTGYALDGDTITFTDREGEMCPEAGRYKLDRTQYYLAFDLVDDMCNGRVQLTMGFWTRPDYKELLEELSAKISETGEPDLKLTRARVYLAIGNASGARHDLDDYIEHSSTNARAYISRAATRFPDDMEGVITDCSRAIELDPGNKNAWFLRGLAHYESGDKEQGCADFSRAIDLGFSILKIAEEHRCSEFWKQAQ